MNKHRGRHSEKRRRQLVYGKGSPIFDTRIRKGSYPPMPIIEFPKGGLGSVPVFRKTKKKKIPGQLVPPSRTRATRGRVNLPVAH
jgi:hypothetical protein